MTKQLITIEFRYREIPKSDLMSEHVNKTITIGIYDTIEEAVKEGNNALNKLAKKYKFRKRFSTHGFMGHPDRLVVDGSWTVFAKIDELKFDDLEATVKEVEESNKKFIKWEKEHNE